MVHIVIDYPSTSKSGENTEWTPWQLISAVVFDSLGGNGCIEEDRPLGDKPTRPAPSSPPIPSTTRLSAQ